MSKNTRSRTLYAHPFSKAYWRDAASELKNTRILVVSALMIALRVAMKGLSITIAPNLYINTAFLANALGAMIFGPVVAIPAAVVSDFLGFLIFPQGGTVYFPPYILIEVASSLIFALLLYRAKLTPTRVILSRFLIILLVNLMLSPAVTMWYYKVILGKSYLFFQIPHIIKSLAFFPIESWALSFVLSVLAPVCYRLGLTFDAGPGQGSMKFQKKQIALLVILLCIGVSCTVGYLFYYYDNTSLSASYAGTERYDNNEMLNGVVVDLPDTDETMTKENTVTIITAAYRKFGKGYISYEVDVYSVDPASPDQKTFRSYSKSKAAKDENMTLVAKGVVELKKDGTILNYSYTPVN